MHSDPPQNSVTGQQRSRPAHAAREAGPEGRVVAVAIGAAVLVAAIGIGVVALRAADKSTGSTPGSALLITVTPAFPPMNNRP